MGRKWSEIRKDLPMRMKLRGTGALPGVLAEGEICPGVSYRQHAESLVMHEAHNEPIPNSRWRTVVDIRTDDLVDLFTVDLAVGQDA
jgi:hypothetical protein